VQGRTSFTAASSQGFLFSNLQCRSGGEYPKSECDINGDSLIIWPLKLSPIASPVATLSPKNFKTVSIWLFVFQKNVILARFWRQLSPFGNFSTPKNHWLQLHTVNSGAEF
jgi:hypothetical protein